MNVLVFGATGMIGQGVLLECLQDDGVDRVIAISRRATGRTAAKLHELVQPDVSDLTPVEAELPTIDACFFCLGTSAAGMDEASYTRVTYDLTLAVATRLALSNPGMTFVYVSGMGTDSSERGRAMWARVKGRTENALLALPFRAAFMFRPGFIRPVDGARSSTTWYRVLYAGLAPLFPLLQRVFPHQITTTAEIGRAMLTVARRGYREPVVESADIRRLGA